jgi:hypothetical protein
MVWRGAYALHVQIISVCHLHLFYFENEHGFVSWNMNSNVSFLAYMDLGFTSAGS